MQIAILKSAFIFGTRLNHSHSPQKLHLRILRLLVKLFLRNLKFHEFILRTPTPPITIYESLNFENHYSEITFPNLIG